MALGSQNLRCHILRRAACHLKVLKTNEDSGVACRPRPWQLVAGGQELRFLLNKTFSDGGPCAGQQCLFREPPRRWLRSRSTDSGSAEARPAASADEWYHVCLERLRQGRRPMAIEQHVRATDLSTRQEPRCEAVIFAAFPHADGRSHRSLHFALAGVH